MNLKKKRYTWLDIAKGITIMLMVIGHTSIPHYLSNFIWAFHMPLFFMAAGWTTNWTKRSFSSYFLHRVRTLVLPFVTYSFLVCLVLNNHKDWNGIEHLIIHGWGGYPLWFIPVLFVASIVYCGIRLISYAYCRYMLIVFMLLIGVVLSIYNIQLPWTMSSVPYAVFLLFIGEKMKIIATWIDNPKWYKIILCFVLTCVISLFWRMDLAWNSIMPVIPLTIGAVSGTLMMFLLSSYIDRKYKKLSYMLSAIGRETYVVVAFASAIIMMFNQYVTQNIIVKYFSLIVILWILVKIKHSVNSYLHINIL